MSHTISKYRYGGFEFTWDGLTPRCSTGNTKEFWSVFHCFNTLGHREQQKHKVKE